MTRSSTSELFTPYEEPEREFRSSRKHFKTLSLDELRSPSFDLFSDQEDYSEEEVAETMAEIMEHSAVRIMKISACHWLRNKPTSSIKTWEELKTKFLNKYCPPARTTKKMEEINNFQQEPDETLFQVWERFKELLMKCPQHYLTKMQVVILFYNGLEVPTRQILDSRGAISTKTVADAKVAIRDAGVASKWLNTLENGTTEHLGQKDPITPKIAHSLKKGKPSKKLTTRNLVDLFRRGDIEQQLQDSIKGTMEYQERRQSMEDTLSKFMSESTKRHEENSNLIKEIRASTVAAIRNQGASIKTLEIQIGKMSKVLQERGFGSLPSSTEANPRDQVKSILTTIEADSYPIRRIGSSQYAVSTGQNRTLMYGT
ncbi:zf-CCHC domain-containing protein [Tanacetum coccineum]